MSRQKGEWNGHEERDAVVDVVALLLKKLSLKRMARLIIQCLSNQNPLSKFNPKEVVCIAYRLFVLNIDNFFYYQLICREKVATAAVRHRKLS